jgi:shikimate kinase
MSNAPLHVRRGLALVGVRGTGKTTVGRLLADRLSIAFFDADLELEARLGRSIREVFATEGEASFRDREEQTLAELTATVPAVIATGGGVVLRDANRRRLREYGFVVWLRANPRVLAERLLADPQGVSTRPALTPAGTLAEIESILAVRSPLYQEIADLSFETDRLAPGEIADAILAAFAMHDSATTPAPNESFENRRPQD